jgi:hypothetical protein
MRPFILAAAVACIATAANAQAPRAVNVRVTGVLTAVAPDRLTVRQTDGSSAVLTLSRNYSVMIARPVNLEAIKPGAYVATANTNIDAKSGQSVELRMFDASNKGAEFSRPMAQANTTMTNGTVQTVKKGAGGRELEVYTPGGSRKIVIPPGVKVIGNFSATAKDLKVGETVTTNAAKAPNGDLVGTRITINKS